MAVELPRIAGRPPRIALLVYNDAHHDSRVLKTGASLRSAGADVRVFAVARGRAGHPEGRALVGEGLEVDRAPEFELGRYAPWALPIARGLTGRPNPDAVAARPLAVSPPVTATPVVRIGRWRRAFTDLWLRTYRTVSLTLYWVHTAKAASRWRPDVIHANDGNTLTPALWIARKSGAHIVYDSHELWLHRNVRGDRPVAPWVEAVIERWGIGRAAGVITVSPSIASWLQQRYHLPRPPTLVRNAPLAGTAGTGPTPADRGRLRELADLTANARVIAYGGRITTSRGIEETMEAMAFLSSDVHLVVLGYGEPDYLVRLHTLIAHHGIAQRVHFVGVVGSNEVSAALADADVSVVFVRPICKSYEFSLPNKLFEAIHAGVPVVAADLPDTAALVREHAVGEIFATPDPVDMAHTIEAVLADPQAYRAAARQAASILTWQHEEIAMLRLYTEVLARGARSRPTSSSGVIGG